MRVSTTAAFDREYAAAPPAVRRAVDKALRLLGENFRHPSLQSHPAPEIGPGVFRARVTLDWRLYYYLGADTYVVFKLTKHPKK
jgi:mRNA-degrading endonuclease RelE of RelBE toxin-antitoxin system